MNFIQNNKKLWLGALIILAAIVIVWGIFGSGRPKTGAGLNETAVNESTTDTAGSTDAKEEEGNDGTAADAGREKVDEGDTEERPEPGSPEQDDQEQGDRTQDTEAEDEAAMLEDQGELEIIIPEDMGTEGF